MNKDTIISIASDVRKWAENYARNYGFKKNLTGLCAIASAELHKRLKKAGIDTVIGMAQTEKKRCHVFLIVEDVFILDVTATQFSKETFYRVKDEIIFANKNELFKYWFWNSDKQFVTAEDLIKNQVEENWYSNQIAQA